MQVGEGATPAPARAPCSRRNTRDCIIAPWAGSGQVQQVVPSWHRAPGQAAGCGFQSKLKRLLKVYS